ncbi:retrovirus-related pol polyprotein from transposon TNT 1-94 [Tanacetum coccineum]
MFAWLSTIVTSISAIASSLFLVVEEDELPSFASGRIEYCGNEKKSLKGCGDVRSCSGFILLGVDLLSGSRGSNLYTISMADMMKSFPICLLSKASKMESWLWHRCLFHLNFGPINKLAKQELKMKLGNYHQIFEASSSQFECYGKISSYRQRHRISQLDSTKLYRNVGITHTTSTARTPQQNGVVERRNRTLVEAARTMLIFSKSLLFLWVEAVATACYTQNCSLIHTRYNKTPYDLLIDRKPELKYLYVFGTLCYLTNDFENLGKLQSKADIGISIGPDLQGLTSGHISSGLVLNQAASTSAKPPIKNDWDLLFQLMFDEYFKNLSDAFNLISDVTLPPLDTARASSSSTFIDKDAPSLSTSSNNEAKNSPLNSTNVDTNNEVAEFDSDTFTNLFAPPDTSSAESSSRIVDTLNMHTFQQPPIYTKRWTKDHPLVTIIDDPSKPVSTRRQLSTVRYGVISICS